MYLDYSCVGARCGSIPDIHEQSVKCTLSMKNHSGVKASLTFRLELQVHWGKSHSIGVVYGKCFVHPQICTFVISLDCAYAAIVLAVPVKYRSDDNIRRLGH